MSTKNTKDQTGTANPPSAPPAGSEIPRADGWYWLRNRVYRHTYWRIVKVGYDAELRERCADWLGKQLRQRDIGEWRGVLFHGPLVPPNVNKLTGGAKDQKQ